MHISQDAIQLYIVLPALTAVWAALEWRRQLLVRGHKIGSTGKIITTAGLQRAATALVILNTAVWDVTEFAKSQPHHAWYDGRAWYLIGAVALSACIIQHARAAWKLLRTPGWQRYLLAIEHELGGR